MEKLKQGTKILTREGNIETILKVNSDGRYYTIENNYSWERYTFKVLDKNGNFPK